MEEQEAKPENHKTYPVHLGTSFNTSTSDQKYLTFRYDFLPASIDTDEIGLLQSESNNAISVLRKHQNNADGVSFKGKIDESVKETECLLVFDPVKQSFRLERLTATAQLRHLRDKKSSQPKSVSRSTLKNTS